MTPSNPVVDNLLLHAGFVQRLARGLAGPDGDDLAQDTWTAVIQAPTGDVRSLRAWLATIAANLWRNGHRTAARRNRRDAAARAEGCCPSVVEILEREEVRRHVVAAVMELPERLRRVVLLRFYEGLDSFAIGRQIDVPASTVRAQLRQALALLRQRLDGAHGDRAAWALPLASWREPPVSSWFGTMLRAVWPVRAVVGAVALLLLTWITWPWWQGASGARPAPQVGRDEVVVVEREKPSAESASTPERVSLPAEVEHVARGPEDLWGRVVAAADDAPIGGAEVVLEHREADEISSLDLDYDNQVEMLATSRTDPAGRFAFRVQRAVQHRLAVRAAGYAPVVEAWCTGGSEFVVRLERPTFVEGSVRREADGTPLADWLVEAVVRDDLRGSIGDTVQTRTAADGEFFLAGVPPQTCYVSVRPVGLQPPQMQVVTPEPGRGARVEFLVLNGCSVRGVVRNEATKQPIAGAEIAPNWARRFAVRSAADGSYGVPCLDERESLYVRAEGYADQVQVVASTQEQLQIDIVLSRGATVVGRIIDRDGRVPAGVYAAAAAAAWPKSTSYTLFRAARIDADGRFRIEGLGVASNNRGVVRGIRWQLLARAPGLGTRVLALPAMPEPLAVFDVGAVVLQPQGMLEGRLVDGGGGALAHAEVTLSGWASDFGRLLAPSDEPGDALGSLARRETRTGSDGSFRFAGLAEGRYEVSAFLRSMRVSVSGGPFAVRDGEVLTVADLVVDAGLTIEGTLRFGGRRELPGGVIMLTANTINTKNGTLRGAASAVVGSDGSFRLVRLEAGDYTIATVHVPPGFAMVVRHGVTAGTKNLELDLVVADVIGGRVVDHEDQPVRRASVYFLIEGAGGYGNARTDADGRFRIDVPPGIVGTVWASHPEVMNRQVQQRDVTAGTRNLTLHLPR